MESFDAFECTTFLNAAFQFYLVIAQSTDGNVEWLSCARNWLKGWSDGDPQRTGIMSQF